MTFTSFGRPDEQPPGFSVIAGRQNGLADLMVLSGRLLAADLVPMHVHQGDEVLRVRKGAVRVWVDDQAKVCERGDVAVFGHGVPHAFQAVTESLVEIVAGYRIGTYYPVPGPDGERWVEVHRRDMPWGRPPAEGAAWTTDEELSDLLRRSTRPI